jgi:hypothetical protein
MDSGQFELGAYRLDAQSRILFREGGVHLALPPKVAKILAIGLGNKRAIEIDQRRVPGGHFSKVTVKYWPAAAGSAEPPTRCGQSAMSVPGRAG